MTVQDPHISRLIALAWQALQTGRRDQAQELLRQALRRDQQDARLWVLMAAALDEPERKRYCLEKALALQPRLPQALQARQALDILEQAGPPVTAEHTAAPAVSTARADLPAGRKDILMPAQPNPEADPTGVHRPPRSGLHSCLLGWLLLLFLAALVGLAAAASPAGVEAGLYAAGLGEAAEAWRFYIEQVASPELSQRQRLSLATQPPLPTVGLPRPATWTPTSSPQPGEPTAPRPTLDLFGFNATPAPSITPFWGEWKLIIGRSVEGRPLEVYRFGSGKKERMIVAGIHGGDEWNTIALADEMIAYVRRRPGMVPPGYTLYILRALNPDGEARDHSPKGRYNANGVDLNRNFDTNWKSSWRITGCTSDAGTGGSGPGSEPETKALKAFLAERHVEALISYHSAGLGVFPSGEPAHPNSIRLAQEIAALGEYVYPPVQTGCEYTGTLVDWAADHGVMAAVDLELNSLNDTEFEANRRILELLMTFDATSR